MLSHRNIMANLLQLLPPDGAFYQPDEVLALTATLTRTRTRTLTLTLTLTSETKPVYPPILDMELCDPTDHENAGRSMHLSPEDAKLEAEDDKQKAYLCEVRLRARARARVRATSAR